MIQTEILWWLAGLEEIIGLVECCKSAIEDEKWSENCWMLRETKISN